MNVKYEVEQNEDVQTYHIPLINETNQERVSIKIKAHSIEEAISWLKRNLDIIPLGNMSKDIYKIDVKNCDLIDIKVSDEKTDYVVGNSFLNKYQKALNNIIQSLLLINYDFCFNHKDDFSMLKELIDCKCIMK